MSYLGKISALVTVNTGDVAPKLNSAAKSVQAFARSVERDIGSSMRSAAKSLDSIYTPLQKLERSLKAATTMKLSFAGFPGAIKDLDALKQRLTSLNQRQINVVLKTSGLKSIGAFREALAGLSSKEFNFVARVGGVEKLRELREAVASGSGEFAVSAKLSDAQARVDTLTEKLEKAKAAGASIAVVVDASKVSAASAELERATLALKAYAAGVTGLPGITPSAAASEISGKLVNAEQKLSRTRSGPAREAAQDEVNRLAAEAAELEKLRRGEAVARRALRTAERGEETGGPREQRRIATQLRAAERERREAIKEAQRVYRDSVGIELSPKDIERIARGGETGLDDLLSRASRSQATALKAGGSGDFVSVVKNAVMPALGRSDMMANAEKTRQMALAEAAVTKPVAANKERLMAAGKDIEAAYLPAFAKTQAAAQSLNDTIERSGGAAADVKQIEKAFSDLEVQIRRDAVATKQFGEARSKLGTLRTGKELVFAAPMLSSALDRGAEIGNRAAELPAAVLRDDPAIAKMLAGINGVSERATAAFAKLRAAQNSGLSTKSAQAELDALLGKLNSLQDAAEKRIQIYVDAEQAKKAAAEAAAAMERSAFVVTGRAQNFEQARGTQSSLEGEISGLNRAQRQNFSGLLREASAASQGTSAAELERYLDILDKITLELAKTRRLNVKQESLDELEKRLRDLREQASFTITGKVTNAAQVESELARIVGTLDSLNEEGRAAVMPKVDAVITSLGAVTPAGKPDIDAMRAALDSLSEETEKQRVIKVNTDEAKAKVDGLRDSLREIASAAAPVVTPMDYMKRSAEEARAAIDKVTDASKRAQLMGRLAAVAGDIATLANPDNTALEGMSPDQIARMQARQGNRLRAITEDATVAAAPTADDIFGANLNTSKARAEALKTTISSVQASIAALPAPLQSGLIPALTRVRNTFAALGDNPTAKQLREAVQEADALEKRLRRVQSAAKFSGTFGSFIRDTAEKRYQAQLDAIKTGLLAVGATATGPVASAVNQYEKALQRAARTGKLGTQQTKDEMERLLGEIQKVAVASGTMTEKQAQAFVGNVRQAGKGDVSRMGADKWSLALNQAFFAVDDFMSSTGGIEFKLRAISNNITQLAFVLGGTTGLFIGLGAVMAGQAAVGIMKWVNGGRTAEDQTKALNDALSRQKGLVEELAEAFRSLGEAIGRGTLSTGAEGGAEFGKSVSDIRRKQRAVAEERLLELDPDSQRRRADLNRLRGELEKEQDAGRRVDIQRDIRELEGGERRARASAGTQTPQPAGSEFETPGLAGIIERAQRAFGVAPPAMGSRPINSPRDVREFLFGEAIRNMPNRSGPGLRELSEQEKRDRAALMANAAGDTVQSQRDAIEAMIARLRPVSEERFLGVSTAPAARASETISRLALLLEQLEAPLNKAIDDLSVKVASASEDAARTIRIAQEDVANAIERGVPGATAIQRRLDELSAELSEANGRLARSAKMSSEEIDPAKRESLVKDAERQVADVLRQQAEIEVEARAARLGRTVGGERTSKALSAIEQSEQFKNERGGIVAAARSAVDAEMQARRNSERQAARIADRQSQLQDAREDLRRVEDAGGDTTAASAAVARAEADLKAAKAAGDAAAKQVDIAQAASELAAALAEAAMAVEASLARIRKVGEGAKQRSEQGADAAQKSLEDNPFRAGLATARDAAESRLVDDLAAVDKAQEGLSNRRREVQADPQVLSITDEMERINQKRQQLEAKSRVGGGLAPAEQSELDSSLQREIELRRQLDQTVRGLTESERKQLDAINQSIAAREKELERNRQRNEQNPAFDRRQENAAQLTAESRRQADEAQRRFIETPTAENRRKRDEAEARLRYDRMRAERVQDDLENKRAAMERDPRAAALSKELSVRSQRLGELAAKEANAPLSPDEMRERERLQRESGAIRLQRDAIVDAGTRPERDAIDREQFEASQRERARRGRDIAMTDRERFRKEMLEGPAGDLNAAAAEMRRNGQDPTAMLRQGIRNQMESIAPMLQQFADARENALLQGPSRAALNVSDVSTSQGASELSRLIRGDDPAKDVNLAELRKQTQKFDELIKAIRERNPGVLL